MEKFILKSGKIKQFNGSLECIEVYNKLNILLCLIWGDGRISPQGFDFSLKEVDYFIFVARNFEFIWNALASIASKDEQIKDLEALVKQLETEMSFIINQN